MHAHADDHPTEPWTWEPSLDDLLDDPVMRTFLASERLTVEHVRAIANDVGRRLEVA